jgi:hypothetical protein
MSKIETAVGRFGVPKTSESTYHAPVLAFRLNEAATLQSAIEEQIRKLG